MKLGRAAVVAVAVVGWLASASAQEPTGLEEAQTALGSGNHARAARLAERAAQNPSATPADRAEAHRVLGLARFFLGDRHGAKLAFVEFVRLDPEAHLDPALVPPEVIVLLEEVRAERAAELAAARPKPRRRPALNLLPPFGQFQNQQRTKGWIIGGLWTSLLATNIGTWALLKSWCEDDGTCPGHQDSSKKVRVLNLVAGAAFAAVYVYGVVDGYVVMKRREASGDGLSLGVSASDTGIGLVLSGSL